MATFRCKRSGNYVEFKNEDDIRLMQDNQSYEEVKSSLKVEPKKADWEQEIEFASEENEEPKKRGRPRK